MPGFSFCPEKKFIECGYTEGKKQKQVKCGCACKCEKEHWQFGSLSADLSTA